MMHAPRQPWQTPTAVAYGRLFFGLFLVVLAYLLMIDPAFAQSYAYKVSGSGLSYFYCSGGEAHGSLYDSNLPCPSTLQLNNLFSFLVCNMERLSGNILGQMYCALIVQLVPAVMAMLTLAVMFFGMGFTIGIIPATARDFQLFLLKCCFVFAFATQSDLIIGLGYNLLITTLREGTAIGVSTMFREAPGSVTGLDVYRYLDNFLGQTIRFATDYIGADASRGENPCKNAIFAVMAVMAVAFPPITFIGMMIIFRVSLTFLRAVFGYLYSLVGITFLLTLSPIFLSFYLFKQTRNFFDKWIGYLVSFTLQMVILFAFLGFILSIDVKHISGSITGIIIPAQENLETGTMRMPWEYCTLCDFKVIDKDGNDITDFQSSGTSASTSIAEGRLVCKADPPEPILITTAVAAPPQGGKGASPSPGVADDVRNALLKFAAFGLLSLLVLAYLVEYMLTYASALASHLAGGLGGTYAPQLGGGATMMGQKLSMEMPGGELANTFERGFIDGFQRGSSATSIGGMAEGTSKAFQRLVLGGQGLEIDPQTGQPRDYGSGAQDQGMVGSFTNFLLNPTRDPSAH